MGSHLWNVYIISFQQCSNTTSICKVSIINYSPNGTLCSPLSLTRHGAVPHTYALKHNAHDTDGNAGSRVIKMKSPKHFKIEGRNWCITQKNLLPCKITSCNKSQSSTQRRGIIIWNLNFYRPSMNLYFFIRCSIFGDLLSCAF